MVEAAYSPTFTPALLLFASAVLFPFTPQALRSMVLLLLPLLVLVLIWLPAASAYPEWELAGFHLTPYQPQAAGKVFASAFLLALFAGNLFALRHANLLELSAAQLYIGSAVALVLCGDLISFFIFWEVMTIGSSLILFAAGTKASSQSGLRYVFVHLLSTALMLAGISGLVVAEGGDISLRVLDAGTLHGGLFLAGILINAGAPPFSSWISDSYPEATPVGTVFLSTCTTKAAVYALLIFFPGETILMAFGLFMIFYGIVYSLLENNIRRILSYSTVNQVGFMITGIGLGFPIALDGATAHAFAHLIFKGLLFMSAGSVCMMAGKEKCTELGGLYGNMKITMVCGIIGALSMSALPLTSGFVSKSLMLYTMQFEQHLVLWLVITAASAGSFLHIGIMYPWFVFFRRRPHLPSQDPPANMCLAMLFYSFLCLFIGVFPTVLYGLLPESPEFTPYTFSHVIPQLQLLFFSLVAFIVMLPLLNRTDTRSLEFDWIYRSLGKRAYTRVVHFCSNADQHLHLNMVRVRNFGRACLLEKTRLWPGSISLAAAIACLVALLAFLLLLQR